MTQIQTSVPEGETPAGRCEYCGSPFPTSDRLVLHKGLEHPSRLDETEREAFDRTYAAEKEALHSLRVRAFGILVLLYFGFLLLYATVA
ncbi:MAG: DNA-binding protein [Haloquadratum sp.]